MNPVDDEIYEQIAQKRAEYREHLIEKYSAATVAQYQASKLDYISTIADYAEKIDKKHLASLARGYRYLFEREEPVDFTNLSDIENDYNLFKAYIQSMKEKAFPNGATSAEEWEEKERVVEKNFHNLVELYYFQEDPGCETLPDFMQNEEPFSGSLNLN